MLRILLVDDSKRALQRADLRLALEGLGHAIVAEISGPQTLWDEVKQYDPDAVIINTESPSREMLEPLSMIRWCLLKRPENLSERQEVKLKDLLSFNLKTIRAYLLKEEFQLFWKYVSARGRKSSWINGAKRRCDRASIR